MKTYQDPPAGSGFFPGTYVWSALKKRGRTGQVALLAAEEVPDELRERGVSDAPRFYHHLGNLRHDGDGAWYFRARNPRSNFGRQAELEIVGWLHLGDAKRAVEEILQDYEPRPGAARPEVGPLVTPTPEALAAAAAGE